MNDGQYVVGRVLGDPTTKDGRVSVRVFDGYEIVRCVAFADRDTKAITDEGKALLGLHDQDQARLRGAFRSGGQNYGPSFTVREVLAAPAKA